MAILTNSYRPNLIDPVNKLYLPTFLVVALSTVQAQQPASLTVVQPEAQRLEPGKPIERELKGGEIHRYTVSLDKGQFFDAVVNQRGIDVVVRVVGPNSLTVAEIDSPNEDQGDEPIDVEAKTTGIYRIEVSPLEKEAKPGRYEIRLNAVLSPEAHAALVVARVAEALRQQKAVIGWLKTNAIPLRTPEDLCGRFSVDAHQRRDRKLAHRTAPDARSWINLFTR